LSVSLSNSSLQTSVHGEGVGVGSPITGVVGIAEHPTRNRHTIPSHTICRLIMGDNNVCTVYNLSRPPTFHIKTGSLSVEGNIAGQGVNPKP
jgi:hypothetical protein